MNPERLYLFQLGFLIVQALLFAVQNVMWARRMRRMGERMSRLLSLEARYLALVKLQEWNEMLERMSSEGVPRG